MKIRNERHKNKMNPQKIKTYFLIFNYAKCSVFGFRNLFLLGIICDAKIREYIKNYFREYNAC